MVEKIRRQALSIQENELLSVEVRKYPCLYDKSKKEFRDKIVVANGWKEVVINCHSQIMVSVFF